MSFFGRSKSATSDAAASSAAGGRGGVQGTEMSRAIAAGGTIQMSELLRKLTDQQGATDTISRMNSQMLGEGA